MRYVAVMPYIVQSYADECLAGCRFDPLLLVDNTDTNLGIMRSHNLGIDLMRDQDADWLIILSAAVRFGPTGGLDLIRLLETSHKDAAVVNAVGLFGWHLMAFSRATIEAAGRWDEHYFPYGFDDNDYAIRIHKALPHAPWWGASNLELHDTTMGHSIHLGGVRPDNEHHLAYFAHKWGMRPLGQPFESFHDHPFNDPANDIRYWPPTMGAEWDRPAPPTDQARVR